MYWQLRKDKKGRPYFSFVYRDPKTKMTVRLRRSEIPSDITTDEQAEKFCRIKEAEHESAKIRIKRKLEWKKKFYDFSKLVDIFEKEIKEMAPNSWENNMYYIGQYTLPFFVNEKQCNNLNNWPVHYEAFRDWLEKSKTVKGDRPLAYSTMNHVISALNSFMTVMKRKRLVEFLEKCEKFPEHKLNRRTIEDVLTSEEIVDVHVALQEINPDSADFFKVLAKTGMRLSEGLGISLADVFDGEPNDEKLRQLLELYRMKAFGYIVLESQVANNVELRSMDKTVPRKPLKGRKRIDPDQGRIIPILEKEVFNIFARRFENLEAMREERKFGKGEKDYLFFDGLNKNIFSGDLRRAYEKLKGRYRHKSPHCLRHTYSTELAGLTLGNQAICRMVLGHKDQDTTDRYTHFHEAINRKVKSAIGGRKKLRTID